MLSRSWISTYFLAILTFIATSSAHTIITYPGWRGDTLHGNGTVIDTNGLIKGGHNASGPYWPYGMQWEYPCGGLPTSTNRTKWPVKGGAVAFQPGWFQGHATALIYINLGYGTVPPNMSNPMLNGVQLIGPTREPYPGSFCFPQVPLPVNASVKVGDHATIQVVLAAVHGASLYNCVDIEFAEPEDVAEVNESNCFNSSQISAELIFATSALTNDAIGVLHFPSTSYNYLTILVTVVLGWLMV